MRRSAIAMLALALILGVVSVLLARDWLVRQARNGSAPQNAQTATVVIAKRPINYGDEIQREYLAEMAWPAGAQPEGSFATIDEILAGEDKRVALRSVQANEPLLKSKVSGFGQRATLSAVIDGEKRAVTIRVNDVIGVAGFVLPGDRVDVLLTRETGEDNHETDVILQKVRVLGVDQEASDAKDRPAVARAVTLEVTPQEAQKLALAGQVGSMTLALRNGTGDEVADVGTIRIRDLIRAPKAAEARQTGMTTVNVVRALARTPTEVRAERAGSNP
jgi:pilus assembly protein CpaB